MCPVIQQSPSKDTQGTQVYQETQKNVPTRELLQWGYSKGVNLFPKCNSAQPQQRKDSCDRGNMLSLKYITERSQAQERGAHKPEVQEEPSQPQLPDVSRVEVGAVDCLRRVYGEPGWPGIFC